MTPQISLHKLSITLATLTAIGTSAVFAEGEEAITWERYSYEAYPLTRVPDEVDRYPIATPASLTVNQHGEIEHLGDAVFGAHWFLDAGQVDGGPVWHFVTSGDPADEVVLMIHGYPDTSWANAEVMVLLSDDYYVIAVDVLGYGQSDKSPEIDVSYEAAARKFQGTSFDIEQAFRMEHVIPNMTMPVLLIQGDRDPGQRAEEYITSADMLPDGRVAIVNTNHFIHPEDPHLVADLARELFTNGTTNRPEAVFSVPVNFQFPVRE